MSFTVSPLGQFYRSIDPNLVSRFSTDSDSSSGSEWDDTRSDDPFSDFSQVCDAPDRPDSPYSPSAKFSRWEWPLPRGMLPYQDEDPNEAQYFHRHSLMHMPCGPETGPALLKIPTLNSLTRKDAFTFIQLYHRRGTHSTDSALKGSSVYSRDESDPKIAWRSIDWNPPELTADQDLYSPGSSAECPSPKSRPALPDLREYMRTHSRFSSAVYISDDEPISPLSPSSTTSWGSIDWNHIPDSADGPNSPGPQTPPTSSSSWTPPRPSTPRRTRRSSSLDSDPSSLPAIIVRLPPRQATYDTYRPPSFSSAASIASAASAAPPNLPLFTTHFCESPTSIGSSASAGSAGCELPPLPPAAAAAVPWARATAAGQSGKEEGVARLRRTLRRRGQRLRRWLCFAP